jgi:membrane protein
MASRQQYPRQPSAACRLLPRRRLALPYADETWGAASSQHSSLDAAGITYYGVWAFFPALASLVALGGLLFGRSEILELLSRIRIELPESFNVVVVGQLQAIAQHSRAVSSVALVGGLAIALWSAMRAMRGLIEALNSIYQENEKRSFWRRQALVLGFTFYGGVFLLVVLGSILAFPPWVSASRQEPGLAFLAAARWPILLVALMVSLSALYRYGPSRRTAKWRWVSWGAAASAIIWVCGSLLFSYYTSQFARYNPLLGSLGAVTLFFLWSYLTVLTILLGAQVNAEMERQAEMDRTGGAPRPLGQRGAETGTVAKSNGKSGAATKRRRMKAEARR